MKLPILEAFRAIEPILVAQEFECDVVVTGWSGDENRPGRQEVPASRPALSVHRLVFPTSEMGGPENLSDEARTDRVSGDRRVLLLDDAGLIRTWGEIPHLHGIEAIAVFDTGYNRSSSMMLFDLGYLRCGVATVDGMTAATYLRSDLIRHPGRMTGVTNGVVAMSRLGTNGRFANQLFQYTFLKLYALRHDLAVATSSWDGQALFGLNDPGIDTTKGLSRLTFSAFDDDDRALWRLEEPLVDIDVEGYFQELPSSFAPHRAFLRNLFKLAPEVNGSIDDWLSELTESSTRPLIAIHVRRGDYAGLYEQGMEWYKPVPLVYYRAWLDSMLTDMPDAIIYIATDAREEVLPYFADIKFYDAESFPDRVGIPAFLTDFEVLRRASYVTVANSSFSRMAAILAAEKQHAVVVNFKTKKFEDYDAWADTSFWARFAPSDASRRGMGSSLEAVQHRSLNIKQETGRYQQITDELRRGYESLAKEATGYSKLFTEKEAYIQTLLKEVAEKKLVIDDLELRRTSFEKLDVDRLQTLSFTRLALAASWNDARSLRRQLDQMLNERPEDSVTLAKHNTELIKRNAALTDAVEQGLARELDQDRALRNAVFMATPNGLLRRAVFRGVLIGLGMTRKLASLWDPGLANKLLDDEHLIRDRRYRQWADLVRARAARIVGMRARPESTPCETLPEATPSADEALLRSAEAEALLALAKETFLDVRKPSVVVVVPWLVQGGSETILMDVLQALRPHVDLSIVTTLPAEHVATPLFRPMAREIHHLGGTLDDESETAFLIAFCQSRNAKLMLSSNATLVYENAQNLKRACPELKIFDLLHNDLRPGHFSSALAATAFIDRHIVVSERISAGLQAGGVPLSQIVKIQNGIDIEESFNPTMTSSKDGRGFLGIPSTKFVVGYVGRMSSEKRPLAFLDIVDALSEIQDLHVVMIGSGPLEEAVETRLRDCGRPFTRRLSLDRPDMKQVYAAIDVLVLPSSIEGMPLVVLEAMAMAVPVAVTNVGNVRQFVNSGVSGFIVEVDKYQDLVGPICTLAKSPERCAAMGKAAREVIVAQALSRSVMLESYVALIREGLGLAN